MKIDDDFNSILDSNNLKQYIEKFQNTPTENRDGVIYIFLMLYLLMKVNENENDVNQ